MRPDKDTCYLDIADTVLQRSTCLRRKYGAVIVKNDEIISTGYNGAPRDRQNCDELGFCYREAHNIPHGERYEACRSVHAECNAIISAPRRDMIGATLYLAGRDSQGNHVSGTTPCSMCRRLIINSGIDRVVTADDDGESIVTNVQDWIDNDDSLSDQNIQNQG